MHISLDCDGTIWEDKYPDVGDLLPMAKETINYWHSRSHTIIINTCRALHYAENAKNYLIANGIKFDFFNENDTKLIQKYGTDTRKISADAYIDDKSRNNLLIKYMIGTEAYNNQFWQSELEEFQFIEKPVIICVVGESGSGKSLCAEYLEGQYNINLIQSYTDRPKRHSEETGHTFLTTKQFNNLNGDVLAYTKFGDYQYCCLVDDLMHINCYVIDEDGLNMLKDKWHRMFDIYSLRLKRPDFDRYESVGEERYSRDKGRFTMKDVEFDYIINNDDNKKEYLFRKIDEFMKIFRLDGRAKEYSTLI